MLRILLWRLGFEALNVLKLVGLRGGTTYYFAFGGNLDPAVLERRRIAVRSRELAFLEDHALVFNHEIPFQGAAFASVEPRPNCRVPGTIVAISRLDGRRLDCFEGCFVFRRYRRRYATVGGKEVFYYVSGRPLAGLKPSAEYLAKILAGYRTILPEGSPFLRALEAQETIPRLVPKDPPRFLVTRYDRFGRRFRPLLERYDRACARVYMKWIFQPSLFQRWLK